MPVSRPVVAETTALGAAYAAGLAVGFWKNTDELVANWQESRRWHPQWTQAQRAAATSAATDGSVWCFSSSQAVTHLQQALPAQDWSAARCVTTHARIAQTAKTLGFGEVHISRPLVADVLASLESLA